MSHFKAFAAFLISFVLICTSAESQTIRLKSGDLPTTNNLDQFIASQQTTSLNAYSRTYFIIQFNQLPSQQTKEQIEASGLYLVEYIPKNAYIASVHNGYPWASLKEWDIKFATQLQREWKIDDRLYQPDLPKWAVSNRQGAVGKKEKFIKLDLQVFADYPFEDALNWLETYGDKIISHHEPFSQIIVDVPTSQIEPLANLQFISHIAPIDPDPRPNNYTGRTLHRSNAINTEFNTSRQYDGTGVRVALGDNGLIGPHIDYKGRYDNSYVQFQQDDGGHGDHTAGTIMGAGNHDPRYEGQAKGVDLDVYYFGGAVQNSNGAHNQDSVMLTSNSWGNGADVCNGGYSSTAVGTDRSLRLYPKLMHLFSAGNDGQLNCQYGAGAGWGNIGGGQNNGKNIICVGSTSHNDNLSGFSSRGPAYDGRIKPDLMGKGSNVISTYANNNYGASGGTSMSCPGVAGVMAQLYQAYRALNNGENPYAGLLKATMMNTAEDLGNAGPDFRYGYGRVNGLRSLKLLEAGNYMTDTLDQGDSITYTITVPSNTTELRVLTYWTDHEASLNAAQALVNDLDMNVTTPGPSTVLPWVLDHTPTTSALNSLPQRLVDTLNNTEQVTIDHPPAGTYTVKVKGTSIPMGPQAFFTVYEFLDSTLELTYPVGGEGIRPGESVKIRWDAWGTFQNFTLEYSLDSGSNWTQISNTVASSRRRYDWNAPSTESGNYLIRISRGNYSDESDTTFSVMEVPSNLLVKRSCPNYVVLGWNLMNNASEYEAFHLGPMYMDPQGITADDTIKINGISGLQEQYFSLKAIGDDHAKSRRMESIYMPPGIFNCLEPNDIAVNAVQSPGAGLNMDCTHPTSLHVKIELKNHSPNSITNVPVFYQYNGGSVVSDTFTGSISAYQTASHTFMNDSIPAMLNGTHDIKAWTAFGADANNLNDTIESQTEVMSGTLTSLPKNDDLELWGLCNTTDDCEDEDCTVPTGWINANNIQLDDIDWRTNMGSTPSNNTGPATDFNPGTSSGRYIYLEATDCFNKRADLLMQCLDLTSAITPTLTFNYQMNGADMGSLHVDVLSEGEWIDDVIPAKSGNFSTIWWPVNIDLTPWAGEVISVRFRGITGPDFASDMALDNFKFFDQTVGVEESLSNEVAVYPNPTEGKVKVALQAKGQIDVKVIDQFGRILMQQNWMSNGNFLEKEIDLSGYAKGVYVVDLTNGKRRWTQRVVRE